MNEELEYVIDRVERHDQDRARYKEMAQHWIQMWKLDPGFSRPLREALDKGHEQVVSPAPFNVVNLSQRLLSSTPKIDVIPADIANKEAEEAAGTAEKWLTHMWKAVNAQQQRNVLNDSLWNLLVQGRAVFDVRWIKDQLPAYQRKSAFPIAIRCLDPQNVGIAMGPYGAEFAYHKYEIALWEIVRKWPDLKEAPKGKRLRTLLDQLEGRGKKNEDSMVWVTDYWEVDDDGKIRNGIIVEDEWAKELAVTSYPMIPMIGARGDYAVGIGDEFDGLSILHSIDGLWQYQCRLASQMATGLYWYFWPHFLVSNEQNLPIDDFELRPGGENQVPPGTRVDQVTMNPNVPLAQSVYDQVNSYIQQGTYPPELFGQAPADLKSGYGVALLSDAAQGRIKNYQEGMEMALTHVHDLVMGLVEKKGGTKGVSLYGVDEVSGERYSLTLDKSMISKIHANEVSITPAMPTDDLQKTVQGTNLANSKYISMQTLRDKYLGIDIPGDESRRIALEELMQSDEFRSLRLRMAAEAYYGPEDALQIIWDAGPAAQEAFMPPPSNGYEWQKNENGKVVLVKIEQQPAPPPQQGPPGGPMPGEQPPMGMEAPMGMEDQSLQGPGVAGPLGGGIPPTMTGQIEGENLGLPQDVDPLLLDMILNQQGGPQQQMNQTIGIQP